jgi:hypothetical protein
MMNLFTAETQLIVNKKSVTAKTYSTKIKAAGSFEKYIKSLGGVFTKYYGKSVTAKTDVQFKEISEYVFGLMSIFRFCYWNGSSWWYWLNSASKSFYTNKITNKGCREGTIAQLCSGSGERLRITNCNYGLDTLLKALGWYKHNCIDKAWLKESGAHKVTSKAKFQKGDIVHFYKASTGKWHHVTMVYAIEGNKIWCLDFGSRFIRSGQPLHYMTVSGSTAGGEYGTDKWQCWHIMDLQKALDESDADLAIEVIHGKYGSGDARKAALGDRYASVQDLVNLYLAPEGYKDYIRACANYVLEGKAGSGEARKKYFGEDYDAVQKKVNWTLEAAQDVIAGKYGTGDARKKALGDDYDLVQAQVNRMME